MNSYQYAIAIGLNGILLYLAFRLASSTNLIKDDSIGVDKPYSFAKSQLFWWTVIILSVFIWCAVASMGLPQLTTLTLALLGISAGTTATASLIDNADKNTTGLTRHQDANRSQSFLKDILSDEQGNYSIHRFQSLVFNVIIGIIFLYLYFSGDMTKFPAFSENQDKYILGLLGISNAGYAALKMGENSPRKDKVGEIQKQPNNTPATIEDTMKGPKT